MFAGAMKGYSGMQRHTGRLLGFFAAATLSAALAGCQDAPSIEAHAEVLDPEVSVVTLQTAPRPYIRELPGRVAPTRIAEVRARVTGIVVEQPFHQGSDVKAGDLLYRIDPAPFEVELQSAEAALAKAEATLEHATLQARRAETLLADKVVSQAQYETATLNIRQARADVAARTADVQRARLNLGYTKVRSPISGRIGRALVTEGALVQGEATHLATVRQLDPIYVDFTQSVSELIQLRRDLESGELERVSSDSAKVRLILDDGTIYEPTGKLLFSEATVDPSTGKVTLRGEFPNPKYDLLPGMYVRVQIVQAIDDDALSVPQQAVQRSMDGTSEVYLVRDDNRAVLQAIRTGRVVDDQWLILDGLKPGDRVIVEGFQKIRAGVAVRPVSWGGGQRAERSPSAYSSSGR